HRRRRAGDPNPLAGAGVKRHIVELTLVAVPSLAAGRSMAPDHDAFLPLKPVELLILTMRTGGERHGHGIRQDIGEHTKGALVLEAGNLYRSMRRLEGDGLVEESGRRPAADADDERRRYYRLTVRGKRVLAAEMLRLRDLVRLAEERRVIAP